MSALRRFLVEFDLDRPSLPRGAWPLLGRDPSNPEPAPPAADPVAQAVSAALAAERAEARAAQAAALTEAEERHAAALSEGLAEARARWAAEQGAALAEGFRAAVAAMEEALAEGAASALEPLVGEAARVLAVAGLREALADLVLAGTGGRIAVSGPADLLGALRDALAASGTGEAGLTFTPSEAAEVALCADNSRIETRLAAWAGALRGRLAAAEGRA